MIIHQIMIGCGVSKARLDIFDNGADLFCVINNDAKAISDWLNKLGGQDVLVVFEATGGYDRVLMGALEEWGSRVRTY